MHNISDYDQIMSGLCRGIFHLVKMESMVFVMSHGSLVNMMGKRFHDKYQGIHLFHLLEMEKYAGKFCTELRSKLI